MPNPLETSHPDSEGYACDGAITTTTDQRLDGKGTLQVGSCAACGAFFEDGELIGHNLDAAQDRSLEA